MSGGGFVRERGEDQLLADLEWVERGGQPNEPDAPSHERLQRLERDDLVTLVQLSMNGRTRLSVQLTGMGYYERERLIFLRVTESLAKP